MEDNDIMTGKVSSEMYPVSELRTIFGPRVRSTGFFGKSPNIIVSFKLFTNLVAKFNVSSSYRDIIGKAIERISFNTVDGMHTLSEVNYIFADSRNRWVAVLKDGHDTFILYPKGNAVIAKDSPKSFIVSTSEMKKYYWSHVSEYPYLNEFAEIIDSKIENRAMLTNDISQVVKRCESNEWVKVNILNCLKDLMRLVTNSYFIIT